MLKVTIRQSANDHSLGSQGQRPLFLSLADVTTTGVELFATSVPNISGGSNIAVTESGDLGIAGSLNSEPGGLETGLAEPLVVTPILADSDASSNETIKSEPATFSAINDIARSFLHRISRARWSFPLLGKTCAWLSICGNVDQFPDTLPLDLFQSSNSDPEDLITDEEQLWQNPKADFEKPFASTGDGEILNEIPDYVLEYAPLVHLYSGEEFWPCDMTDHLSHTTPELNYTALQARYQHPTLANLDRLNRWQQGRYVFLTSDDDVEERPEWLGGSKNIPASNLTDQDAATNTDWIHHPGRTYLGGLEETLDDLKENLRSQIAAQDDIKLSSKTQSDPGSVTERLRQVEAQMLEDLQIEMPQRQDVPATLRGGRSEAPAVLVVVDKGHGVIDAFWFFFYSFNLGNSVFNVRFGNHVGDWEHSAVRFHHGKPKAVYFSEHSFGAAYSYDAVEKLGKRPVIYSATGTHAMYPTAGTHPYVLPWGILHDQTDRGPLWDPSLNSHMYTYDFKHDLLRASNFTPKSPTEWFYFSGSWGDKAYPLSDRRQYMFAGQWHYVNGPLGPRFKNLGRKKICGGPDSMPCVIKNWLGGPSRIPRWQGNGEEADAFSAMTSG